jgi:hypothetical protein
MGSSWEWISNDTLSESIGSTQPALNISIHEA